MQYKYLCVQIILTILMTDFVKLVNSVSTKAVARALPEINVALTGTPIFDIGGVSRITCLEHCIKNNCSSFNYGQNQCELLPSYLCNNTEVIYARALFKHYDVEIGNFVPIADTFRQENDCITQNRCSPKCYITTTTTTIPPVTTTTPILTTTTTQLTTASPGPPGPGEVGYSCSVNVDCTTPNSDCRSGVVCECVAGYSYNPPTKTCVRICPGEYSNSFSLTMGYFVADNNMATYDIGVDLNTCGSLCMSMPGCISFEFDDFLKICNLSPVTKYEHENLWNENIFFLYAQRNCV